MKRHRPRTIGGLLVLLAILGCDSGTATAPPPFVPELPGTDARVLKLEELTYPEIDRIDRNRAIVFITFGNLEEHGPHLPVGSDYFQAIGLRDRLIARLATSHPDHSFIVMPVIPLGEGGFNDVARQFDHVGTLAVRFSTLRDVAVDVGSAFAARGFKNIFLIHYHGPALHNIALTQASEYVSERFDARMVNITSLMFGAGIFSPEVLGKHLSDGWEERLGLDLHSGPAETSTNLYLRGDLVSPDYKSLPAFPVKDFEELGALHRREGFRGYANHPARATRELGRDLVEDAADRAARIARMALDGEDLTQLESWPDVLPLNEDLEETLSRLEQRYDDTAADLAAWLETRP